jgi:hypothetical protein
MQTHRALTDKQRQKMIQSFPDNKMKAPDGKQLSRAARLAFILDWWATVAPFEPIDYSELLKLMEGYSHWPRKDNKECRKVAGQLTLAGQILETKYHRRKRVDRGIGVRASVDDEDVLKNFLPDDARTTSRQTKRFQQRVQNVNISKVPNTLENRPHIQWYRSDAQRIVKEMSEGDFATRMLPPSAESGSADAEDESERKAKKK